MFDKSPPDGGVAPSANERSRPLYESKFADLSTILLIYLYKSLLDSF